MWETALIIAVIIFGITCFFLILTLVEVKRSLSSLQTQVKVLSDESVNVLRSTEARLALLDSSLRSISNIGDMCEFKSSQVKQSYLEQGSKPKQEKDKLNSEFVDWALLTVDICQTLLKRR